MSHLSPQWKSSIVNSFSLEYILYFLCQFFVSVWVYVLPWICIMSLASLQGQKKENLKLFLLWKRRQMSVSFRCIPFTLLKINKFLIEFRTQVSLLNAFFVCLSLFELKSLTTFFFLFFTPPSTSLSASETIKSSWGRKQVEAGLHP